MSFFLYFSSISWVILLWTSWSFLICLKCLSFLAITYLSYSALNKAYFSSLTFFIEVTVGTWILGNAQAKVSSLVNCSFSWSSYLRFWACSNSNFFLTCYFYCESNSLFLFIFNLLSFAFWISFKSYAFIRSLSYWSVSFEASTFFIKFFSRRKNCYLAVLSYN